MRTIAHPNAVRLHATHELPGREIHLVLDLCCGEDLARVVRRRGALAQKVVIGGGAVAAGAVLWRRRSKNPRAGLVKPNDTPLNHLHRVNAAWEKL